MFAATRSRRRPCTALRTRLEDLEGRIALSGAATQFAIAVSPAPVVAGAPLTVKVTAEDANGQIVPTFTDQVVLDTSDPNSKLDYLLYTFTQSDHGVHAFTTSLDHATDQGWIAATDNGAAGVTGVIRNVQVVPGSVAKFGFGPVGQATAGQPQSVMVFASDKYGNPITNYTGTVQLTSSDPKAVLPVAYTITSADAGTHTFTATFETAGAQSITATSTGGTSLTGTDKGIAVSPAAASKLVIHSLVSSITAGVADRSIIVTALDPYGNIATGYSGTIQFTGSDMKATLPGTFTFQAGDKGTYRFAPTLRTAGPQTMTVTDTANPNLTGEIGIQVDPAATKKFVISGLPATSTAGTPDTFTVTAEDVFGNVTPAYRGEVQFTSTDKKAALPGDVIFTATNQVEHVYTFTESDQGVHAFAVTFKTATSTGWSLGVHDTATPAITGGVTGILVTPGAPTWIGISGNSIVFANYASRFHMSIRDACGNLVTNFDGTVDFTSTDPNATLPPPFTFSPSDDGQHVFNVTFHTKNEVAGITVTNQDGTPFSGRFAVNVD
jgi:hypothetical protein